MCPKFAVRSIEAAFPAAASVVAWAMVIAAGETCVAEPPAPPAAAIVIEPSPSVIVTFVPSVSTAGA